MSPCSKNAMYVQFPLESKAQLSTLDVIDGRPLKRADDRLQVARLGRVIRRDGRGLGGKWIKESDVLGRRQTRAIHKNGRWA